MEVAPRPMRGGALLHTIHYYLPLRPAQPNNNNILSIQTAHSIVPPITRGPKPTTLLARSSCPSLLLLQNSCTSLAGIWHCSLSLNIFLQPVQTPLSLGLMSVFPTQEVVVIEVNAHKAARLQADWTRAVATVPGDKDGVGYVEASRIGIVTGGDCVSASPFSRAGGQIHSEIHMMEFLSVHYPEDRNLFSRR
ncbi:hypothetical protein JOM56_013168 [Amanita muscaria]